MCGLGMEAVPPGPVARGWSMKGDTGTSKPVCDILREMLKQLASKHGLICLSQGKGAELDGLLGWSRTAIPECLSSLVSPRTLQTLIHLQILPR